MYIFLILHLRCKMMIPGAVFAVQISKAKSRHRSSATRSGSAFFHAKEAPDLGNGRWAWHGSRQDMYYCRKFCGSIHSFNESEAIRVDGNPLVSVKSTLPVSRQDIFSPGSRLRFAGPVGTTLVGQDIFTLSGG